jgi:hypothetical protein
MFLLALEHYVYITTVAFLFPSYSEKAPVLLTQQLMPRFLSICLPQPPGVSKHTFMKPPLNAF